MAARRTTSLKDAQKADAERKRKLNALIKKTNDSAKRTVIAFAEDVPNAYMLRRPTGILELDRDLAGGFPAGTLNVISGPEGAGKTMLMYRTMAMQQRIFGDACMLGLAPIESRVDHFFMRMCGVKVAVPDAIIDQRQDELSRLQLPLLSKDEIKGLKHKVGEFVLTNESTMEGTLDQVLRMVEANIFQVIGIDSFSASQPGAEATVDSLGDSFQQGAAASVLTRFQKRLSPCFAGLDKDANMTTLLGICQVRANRERSHASPFMQKFIAPYTPSIPYAIRHCMTVSLLVYPGEKIKEGGKKGKKEQVGKVLKWRTEKGRAGLHEGIMGEVDYEFDGGVDTIASVFSCALSAGILVEKGGIFSAVSHRGEMIYENLGPADTVRKLLEEDVELEMRIRMEVLRAAEKSCVYW